MAIADEYAALLEVVEWVDKYIVGAELVVDEATLLAQGCFEMALENQAAIAVLYASRLHGSLFTLLSGLTEALIRGLWLIHCASDGDIVRYKLHQLDKTFAELLTDVENSMGNPSNVLLGLKVHAWRAMHGVARAGLDPGIWRCGKRGSAPSRSQDEVEQALILSGALGLVAAGQLAGLYDRDDLVELAILRMQDYANRASSA